MSPHPPHRPSSTRPPLDFQRLRQVPIEHVLAARGIRLARRGIRDIGPCPVHGGDNPGAFVVHRQRNTWHCFTRCGGGDVIDLLAAIDGISIGAAARHLDGAAMDLPPVPPSWRNERVFVPFTRRLPLDPRCSWLHNRGIDPETARRFEAGAWHGRGFLQGCIGVRLHDPAGRPLGYAGRRRDPRDAARHGKWKLPAGLPKTSLLYNWHRLGRARRRTLVLVEGPWDVLALARLRVPAVALLGTRLSTQQGTLLAHAEQVVVMLDGDPAGRAAAAQVAARLQRTRVVQVPDGTDPGDLVKRELRGLLAPFFSL